MSHKQRILVKSNIAALLFFVLFTTVTLSLITRQRVQYQRTVKEHTLKTTLSYINHLVTTMQQMLPLTAKPCLSRQADITYQAAFTSGVRTFLLVKNGYAYCSSASGDLMLPLKILYPEINWSQHLDFKLQQDTPTMPGKPTVAVWLRQPDRLDTRYPGHIGY